MIVYTLYDYFKLYPHVLKQRNNKLSDNRQKYNCIAGSDTEAKINFEEILKEVSKCIMNSRSEFDFFKNQKYLKEKYSKEARYLFYSIFENGSFKEEIKKRAKKLLLDFNS